MFFAQHQAASSGVTAEALARTDEARQGAWLLAMERRLLPRRRPTRQHPSRRSTLGRSPSPRSGRRCSSAVRPATAKHINELAHRLGQSKTLVRVHMDEQIDSKVLLGTYVCSEGAGEFTGSLASSARRLRMGGGCCSRTWIGRRSR